MRLTTRAPGPELMDADDLPADVYTDVVGDLAKVNGVTLAATPTLAFLSRIVRPGGRLRLIDIGYGDGDMLRRIEIWARRRHIDVELVGVDLNPRSEAAARAHTPAGSAIRYVTGDYTDMGDGWDTAISSLVAHHMTEAELIAFLRWMDGAARSWFVNDLHRHWFAHAGFPLLARVARWHPIVRLDGTLSIARSFRPDEWPPLLAAAGIADARVFRVFPFRLCVEKR